MTSAALRWLVVCLACALPSCRSEGAPPSPIVADDDPSPPSAATQPERPMMIVFERDYCAPCRIMEPWVRELARELPAVDIVEVNVDREAHQELGRFFQITSVPALVFVDAGGRILRRRNGLASKTQMLAALRSLGWTE